jgi:hypothetical protein
MKFRNVLLNVTIGLITLFFGLALVGTYNFLFGNNITTNEAVVALQKDYAVKCDLSESSEKLLPIDFEEDQLTSPKSDETNEAYFDPEGFYYFDGFPKGFEDFLYIRINNKNFDVAKTDSHYGDLVPLNGFVILDGKNRDKQIRFEEITAADGKLRFVTETEDGIKYEFNGEFLVKGNFYTLDENAKVLSGTLVKKADDKIVAKNNLTFKWTLEAE